ncbi:FAD synthetase family protein [Cytobacillus sp. S13-E01]|uniref:FAD synthetase family protein n=1 Tax=Cytobacillus sp. S13-E01 TaxID=3031326 RepID=UPI0023D87F05|nr:FAD synthetase family protein [Cytobacillus sp. S13-E01]MDF0726511.1 FAD synthetase family protein [Cytobacillus sp. S13-E01]
MEAHFDTSLTLPCSNIAIGAFDGVHQGHQTVIKQVVERSKILQVPSLVYTFDPPPRVYFQGASILTPITEKLSKLEKLGVDHVIVASFNQLYAKRSANHFIGCLSKLNPIEIVVGEDFRFGKDRVGDITLLEQYFKVRVTQPVCCSMGNRISSTRIRQLISNGDIHLSNSLLGWPIGE